MVNVLNVLVQNQINIHILGRSRSGRVDEKEKSTADSADGEGSDDYDHYDDDDDDS